jgi:hypothetical protein
MAACHMDELKNTTRLSENILLYTRFMHPKLFIYVICKYLNLFTEYGLGDGIFQLMVARYINIHEIPYTRMPKIIQG